MVDVSEKITFSGESKVDGTIAERYSATIDKQNPENITFGRYIVNSQLRKDNRDQCRADQAQFEDDVYATQDEMIAQDSKVSNLEEG